MKFFISIHVAAVATAILAAAENVAACATGVHMIVARGSTEAPGPGLMGATADAIKIAIPGSDIESVDYPATIKQYAASVAAGIKGMSDLLTNYTTRCPESKVALLGYSQGAQVTLDMLCGVTSNASLTQMFSKSDPYSASVVNKSVIAVVAYGDPTHQVGAPWNRGSATAQGIFPRKNITACEPYKRIISSWCDNGDVWCALGNKSEVHRAYFRAHLNETVAFVVRRYGEATHRNETKPTSTASGTGSPNPSPTGTSDAGMLAVSWAALAATGLLGLLVL